MKVVIIYLFIIFLIVESNLYSSDISRHDYQFLLENLSIGSDQNSILDQIDYLTDNPIDLRSAGLDELTKIPGLNYNQIMKLLEIVKSGNFENFYERLVGMGFSSDIIDLLKKITYYQDKDDETKNKSKNKNQSSSVRFRDKMILNPPKNNYLGSNLDYNFRMIAKYNDFQANFISDKDFGEVKIGDFTSASLSYLTDDFKVILGDFSAELGLGSLLWDAFSQRKGEDVTNLVLPIARGFKPSNSSFDLQIFRGMAIEKSFNGLFGDRLIVRSFYSNSSRSSVLDSLGQNVSSINKDGYFRTETELSHKNNLNEKTYLINIEESYKNWLIGVSNMNLLYNKNIISENSRDFDGKNGNFLSIYTKYNSKEFSSGVEITSDANSNIAYKLSMQKFFENTELSVHYRYAKSQFKSPFSANFGESSNFNNENGLYFGFKHIISKDLVFLNYIDLYNSLSSTSLVAGMIKGLDFFNQLNFDLNSNYTIQFRFKYEDKTASIKDNNGVDRVIQEKKTDLRADIIFHPNNELTLKLRNEAILVEFEGIRKSELGLMSYFDISYELWKKYLECHFRYALFSTDSFESAIYIYEYAVRGLTSTNAVFNRGNRVVLDLRTKFIKNIDAVLRYTQTNRYNASNPLEAKIYDPRIYFQIDYKF